ncbi:MAG: hypothetical protein HC835_11200 [Oscillatoriales cyanobacterium RM2_1_1]|nr:hypothetical protein [Oscillatoriales cyanobacterium RM2_1_1]
MTQIDTNPASQSIEVLKRFNLSLLRSANLFRWVGYGFLLLTLLDIAEILFPPRFMNPAWELQAMGQLVERVAVPLLGFILVFFGERNSRERWEVPLVKLFSWLTLLYAVLYFLLVPLGVINTLRIDKQNNQQITTQIERLQTQIQELQTRLGTVNTPEEMETLIGQLNNGQIPQIQGNDQFETVKKQLNDFVSTGKERLDTQSKEARSNQRNSLFKRSIKWNLGALVSGLLFVSLFRGTAWARQRW